MQVLVVDDDAVARQLITVGLTKLGHEVMPADDGTTAWSICESLRFPVVVTDWMMPGMDGLELCRRIRQAQTDKYTYIILLTGVQGRAEFLSAMAAGVDDFLSKPVDLEHLAVRVRVAERILGLRMQVAQLESLLPICAYCKRIRGDGDGGALKWEPVERVLERRTGSELSHGICPDCYDKHMKPAIDALK
jgi:DNA-binding response OmpR family regulator